MERKNILNSNLISDQEPSRALSQEEFKRLRDLFSLLITIDQRLKRKEKICDSK